MRASRLAYRIENSLHRGRTLKHVTRAPLFCGTELAQVVASRPNARAYRLDAAEGRVIETRLATRYLDCDATPLPLPGSTSLDAAESSTTGVVTAA